MYKNLGLGGLKSTSEALLTAKPGTFGCSPSEVITPEQNASEALEQDHLIA